MGLWNRSGVAKISADFRVNYGQFIVFFSEDCFSDGWFWNWIFIRSCACMASEDRDSLLRFANYGSYWWFAANSFGDAKIMEVTFGDYGRMMFENMLNPGRQIPHWESIRAEAEPLVRQLVELNSKMSTGGYQLYGHINGKEVFRKSDYASEAIKLTWGVPVSKLKKGDLVCVTCNDVTPMSLEDHLRIDAIGDRYIYGDNGYALDIDDMAIKIPDDWDENYKQYISEKYWLDIAKEKGVYE